MRRVLMALAIVLLVHAASAEDSPDLEALADRAPAALVGLVKHCLDQNLESRLDDIAEARRTIERELSRLSSTEPAESKRLHNLPRQFTSFVGRVREKVEVTQLLSASPLVTLTGVGGCGKSRLALQVAAEVADRYEHGS